MPATRGGGGGTSFARTLADSTTTALAGGATYTSAAFDTSTATKIVGTCLADQPGTLHVEQSQDGINWDVISSRPVTVDPNSRGTEFDVEVAAPYGRVRYVNLATAQTVFRLYTYVSNSQSEGGNRVEPRKTTQLMHNAVDLTSDETDYASEELDCVPYSKFLLMYDITETGTLVNGDRLRIRVQHREPGGTWRDYVTGPFGALYEEESTTPCNLSVSGDCVGEKMRIVITTDYTNADPSSNYFTITTKVILME